MHNCVFVMVQLYVFVCVCNDVNNIVVILMVSCNKASLYQLNFMKIIRLSES